MNAHAQLPSPPPVAFHFITAVWGEAYTRLYVETVLPTQVSAGNLGAFRGRDAGDVYWVYTTREAAETIRAAPVFATLSGQVGVRFAYIDDLFAGGRPKHTVLTEVHKRAIAAACTAGAAMVFLCPDAIWSDGSFARLIDLAGRGVRAVMMPGIRLCAETFLPALHRRFDTGTGGPITVPPRPLTGLALAHLHQITSTLFWDAPLLNPHMSHLYFRLPGGSGTGGGDPARCEEASGEGGGIVARCFHLHPFMVLPQRSETRFHSTIDGDFVPLACPDPAHMHVVTDSDEMVVYELSDASMNIPPRWDAAERLTETALWVRQFADPYHRRYARLAVRVHDGTPSAEAWRAAEDESRRVLEAIHERRRELDFFVVRAVRRLVTGGAAVGRPAGRAVLRWAGAGGPGAAGEGGLAAGADPVGSLGPGRPGLAAWGYQAVGRLGEGRFGARLQRVVGPARAVWFRRHAQLRANGRQWHARARRRYWLASAPVKHRYHRLVARRRQVGWLRLLGVRSHLRRWLGLPPRPGVDPPRPPSRRAVEARRRRVDRLPR